ncbi:type IV secretory system conjugative DNA transfer family protein [Bradyrhizobium sp. STM 3809]|uniref:type IV secretory system conjugative DNA transfer family protein n=1 Tax=Bradyrhizobium sp. STM 3809 TaxID=551936 RepID=UPI0002406543|nr:type IV secretory system conjugative DNA transfer family protein [Bradyrhizobium sp. STM 3809]CCD97623.1 putative conjugation traG/virD4 like protein [Bradyrhizobium sp. STM 3809]
MPRDEALFLGLTNDKRATPVHYMVNGRAGQLNSILFGPPGSGKDTGLIVPNIAHLRRSVFVVDVKGETAATTWRHRARFSRCIAINPYRLLADTHPHLRSRGLNPLKSKRFDPASDDFSRIAMRFGDGLVKQDGNEAFFAVGGKALTAGLTMWARIKHGDNASLTHVRRMMAEPFSIENGEPVGLYKTLVDMSAHGDRRISEHTNRFLTLNKSVIDVISTTIGQQSILSDPAISADLDGPGFDFTDLKRELVTCYIILPATELSTASLWLRLVVGCALHDLMSSGPGSGPRPLLILNEVGQLGFLEPLATALGISRGYGFDIMTVWQSLSQIQAIYGKEFEKFLAARGVLSSYAPQDWGTAEYLSKLIGKLTARMNTINAKPGQAETDLHDTQQGYPVLHPEDLMRLPPRTLINFVEGVSWPFLTHAPGYWQLPWCGSLDPNPYHIERKPAEDGQATRGPSSTGPTPPPSSRADRRRNLEELTRRLSLKVTP